MGERLAYAHRLRRLRRLSKDVSRKIKGSHNRRKAIRRLWRHQTRMANLRRDVLHKLTTEIVRRAASIGIEALTDVFNGRVFRAIAELGVYEFRRQPKYLQPDEVADLRLDDIDWRGGTIEVRTRKNRRGALLPLPCVVGQASVDYLGGECPATDERRVFVQLLGALACSAIAASTPRDLRQAGSADAARGRAPLARRCSDDAPELRPAGPVLLLGRFIPARAGIAYSFKRYLVRRRIHPRSCGDGPSPPYPAR